MSREVGMTFSAPMSGAIWRDEKWQTRRLVRVPEGFTIFEPGEGNAWAEKWRGRNHAPAWHADRDRPLIAIPPRLRVGDVMVVREPWRTLECFDRFSPAQLLAMRDTHAMPLYFEADGDEGDQLAREGRYRQAMHMPHAFARSRRICTGVRVERLGDISEADAMAEGVGRIPAVYGSLWGVPLAGRDHPGWDDEEIEFPHIAGISCVSAVKAYAALWDAINGPGAWDRDRRKWVFVYEFARRT